MSSYLLPVLAIAALCAAWGAFQIWLDKQDPDAKRRSLKCGACGRKDDCSDRQQR